MQPGPGRSAHQRGVVLARRRRRSAAVAILAGAAALAAGAGGHLVLAVAAGGAAVLVLAARPRDVGRWSRGADGEKATAALLERLGARDYVVLHDRRVPGSRANVDHLVIGRSGVWVVDSKAYRAPVDVGWRSVRVGGRRMDTAPVAWEAQVVADRLEAEVTPIVAVHAVGLPRRGRRCAGVKVVPAKRLVSRIRRGRRRLTRDQTAYLAARAERTFVPAAHPARYG